jgi:hypothetical protein
LQFPARDAFAIWNRVWSGAQESPFFVMTVDVRSLACFATRNDLGANASHHIASAPELEPVMDDPEAYSQVSG